jgi:hypothetical protein
MNKMSDEELLAFIKKYLLVDNRILEKKDWSSIPLSFLNHLSDAFRWT